DDAISSEFQRLAKFVGLDRTDAEIQTALAKSTRQKQQKDFENHPLLANKAVGVGAGAGKWREYFSEELHDDFWRAAGRAMAMGKYRRD
ncbi:MAG: hypothetical protein Q8L54_02145, partial [Devosia sp.]|nr:hypothetical protein [Devosia sp.]